MVKHLITNIRDQDRYISLPQIRKLNHTNLYTKADAQKRYPTVTICSGDQQGREIALKFLTFLWTRTSNYMYMQSLNTLYD